MRSISRRLLAVAVATGAAALAAPVSGASAVIDPPIGVPVAGSAIGGNQIGSAGCVGTNRPSFSGNSGSTSAQTCGTLTSSGGPQTGQISTMYGPVTTDSPVSQVLESAGPITILGP